MLGHDLVQALMESSVRREVAAFDHHSCDITDPVLTLNRLTGVRPDVIVHLAALTKVNECQRDPARAFAVNGEGTANVARAANATGARFVYVSTDYVFNGRKSEPYVEEDAVDPINMYGRSKLAGEHRVPSGSNLIVRSGWLYGTHGRNFVEAILEQAAKNQPLRVVADQVGCPTYTAHLARAIVDLIDAEAEGIVHVSGGGQCSWHEFACSILEQGGLSVPVEAVASPHTNAPDATPRPAYTVLSNARMQSLGITALPHWRDALREYLAHRP
jgi:dTDP-4-dehydrorhamnose reductase